MKKCFKCGELKDISEYYKHPGMADGHLGKCKDCTKKDTKSRVDRLINDPVFRENERIRGRDKYHKYKYKSKHTTEQKRQCLRLYRQRYPEKYKSSILANGIKPLIKGNHMHHWSYNIEDARDVIELSRSEHYKLHRYIVYDQERMMYRRIDTMELLDTRESHYNYYLTLKDKP